MQVFDNQKIYRGLLPQKANPSRKLCLCQPYLIYTTPQNPLGYIITSFYTGVHSLWAKSSLHIKS